LGRPLGLPETPFGQGGAGRRFSGVPLGFATLNHVK
jgi:hypothetical protein